MRLTLYAALPSPLTDHSDEMMDIDKQDTCSPIPRDDEKVVVDLAIELGADSGLDEMENNGVSRGLGEQLPSDIQQEPEGVDEGNRLHAVC